MPLRPRVRRTAAGGWATLVLAVAATALATLPVPTPSAAAPPARAVAAAAGTVAELRLSRSQAITGERVDLRVTVSPTVRRVVVLQRRDGDRWVEVTRGRTDASGREVFTRSTPRADTTWRVRAPRADRGGTTYAADVSPGRLLTVQRQDVYLRLPESATAGSVVPAVVECFPRRGGRPVVLWQRLGDQEWESVATGAQGGQGIASFQVPVEEAGDHDFRAVVAAADGAPEARSASRRITVAASP